MKTRVTELLRIRHPIIQGAMTWGSLTFGQACGMIRDIPTCRELSANAIFDKRDGVPNTAALRC